MARKSSTPSAPRPQVLSLLEQAKDTPDDDAPRLVLADWLEENGDDHDRARAELIRVQCRRASLISYTPAADELDERIVKLWRGHKKHWLGRLCEFHRADHVHLVGDERGLISITLEGGQALTKKGEALAGTEEFGWVDGLRFHTLTREGCCKLLDSPLLDGLNRLNLGGTKVAPADVAALADCPRLARLCELSLDNLGVGLGVRAVAESKQITRLTDLNLRYGRLGDEAVAAIARGPALAHLRNLRLDYTTVGPEGARALAESKTLRGLRELSMGGSNRIGDEGVAALANSAALSGLTSLEVWSNEITDRGAEAIARSSTLHNLVGLELGGNHLGNEGAAALAGAAHLAGLRRLNLSYNGIGAAGAIALGESPYLTGLTQLVMKGNKPGKSGTAALKARFGEALE